MGSEMCIRDSVKYECQHKHGSDGGQVMCYTRGMCANIRICHGADVEAEIKFVAIHGMENMREEKG